MSDCKCVTLFSVSIHFQEVATFQEMGSINLVSPPIQEYSEEWCPSLFKSNLQEPDMKRGSSTYGGYV